MPAFHVFLSCLYFIHLKYQNVVDDATSKVARFRGLSCIIFSFPDLFQEACHKVARTILGHVFKGTRLRLT